MLGLGPIAFAVPWILGALIVLPILWWLLRLTPPSPFKQAALGVWSAVLQSFFHPLLPEKGTAKAARSQD